MGPGEARLPAGQTDRPTAPGGSSNGSAVRRACLPIRPIGRIRLISPIDGKRRGRAWGDRDRLAALPTLGSCRYAVANDSSLMVIAESSSLPATSARPGIVGRTLRANHSAAWTLPW